MSSRSNTVEKDLMRETGEFTVLPSCADRVQKKVSRDSDYNLNEIHT